MYSDDIKKALALGIGAIGVLYTGLLLHVQASGLLPSAHTAGVSALFVTAVGAFAFIATTSRLQWTLLLGLVLFAIGAIRLPTDSPTSDAQSGLNINQPLTTHTTYAARAQGIPVIYAKDNFGQWRSDFKSPVDACMQPNKRGHKIAARLHPHEDDYFVLKPRHSAFYGTPLELVLRHLGVDTLVLAGFATDLCVLFTAHDAHMRGFNIFVPEDCTASNSPEITQRALAHIRQALHGGTGSSEALEFSETAG